MTTTPPRARDAAHPAVIALGAFVVFTALAHDAWRLAFGLPGVLVVGALATTLSVVALAVLRPRPIWGRLPWVLALYLLYCLASLTWSAYPSGSVASLGLQWTVLASAAFVALCFDRDELLRVLSIGVRWILGVSLVFEFVVAVFVGHRILPFFFTPPGDSVSVLYYWSRSHLFDGGRVQGIVGNADTFAFAAVIGLIVFALQLADRRVRRGTGIAWIVVALLCLGLTRSATILIAMLALAFVVVVVWLVRRCATLAAKASVLCGAVVVAAAGTASALVFADPLLALIGRNPTLTHRTGIWESVSAVASQHPVAGWGFASPWMPWAEPLDGLVTILGAQQLEAHNTWIDVWMQLGVIGLVLFSAVVLGLVWRSWRLAVERPRLDAARWAPYTATTLLPLLVTVLLLVRSITESSTLYLGGWFLLATFALHTAFTAGDPHTTPGRPRVASLRRAAAARAAVDPARTDRERVR